MKYKHGEGTKKVPLPVAVHLNQAVGALTLHTGRNYKLTDGHKKCQRLCWRTSSPDSNVLHCKDGGFFSKKQIIKKNQVLCQKVFLLYI